MQLAAGCRLPAIWRQKEVGAKIVKLFEGKRLYCSCLYLLVAGSHSLVASHQLPFASL